MTKTKRKATAARNHREKKNSSEIQEIIIDSEKEKLLIVKNWKAEVAELKQKMMRNMHDLIASMPAEIAEMTVGDYIKGYVKHVKKTEELEKSPSLEEIPTITLPKPNGETVAESSVKSKPKQPRRKPASKAKKAPATTRSTRSKRFETPSRSKAPFVMVEGTPMLTKRDTSHLNLTDKPRPMKSSDDISAVGFNLYSSRGSPMTIEISDAEVQKKVQEALQMLMQEAK